MLESSKGIRGKWAEWAASPRKSFWVMLVLVVATSAAFMSLLPASTWYESFGIDTYCYIGYGYTYPERWYAPSYYKISRLPWVLFLSVYYNLINSDYAIPLLAVSRTLVQGILVYIVAWRFTRNLASSSLIALFVAASSLWGHVGGWNYHAVPGVILLLIAIAFLPLKTEEVSFWRYFASFSFFSLGLHTNPYILFTVPAFAALCLTPIFDEGVGRMTPEDSWRCRKQFLLRIVAYAVGIFILTTAWLAGIHKVLYGTGAFWKNNFRMGARMAKDPSIIARYAGTLDWDFLTRPYVLFLLCSVFCALFVILKNAKKREIRLLLPSFSFLLALFGFVAVCVLGGWTTYNHDYNMYVPQCYAVLAWAFFADMFLARWRSSLRAAIVLILCGFIFFIIAGLRAWLPPAYLVAAIALVLFLLGGMCFRGLADRYRALSVVLIISLLSMMMFQNGRIFGRVDTVKIALNRAMLRHYQFILALNGKEVLNGRENRSLDRYFSCAYVEDDAFLRDRFNVPANRLMRSFIALSGAGFLGYKSPDFILPSSPDKKYEVRYREGMKVVVLGSSPELSTKIESGLRNLGLEPTLQHVRMETSEDIDVYMWIYAIERNIDE